MRLLLSGLAVLFALAADAEPRRANTWHVRPGSGRIGNNGSAARPWSTLEEVVTSGKLTRVKPGDTILLYSGDHGNVRFSGDNRDFITIEAAPKQKPRLSRLEIEKGSKWVVRGLTISPSFGKDPYKGCIVTIGERGASSDLVVEDCWVHAAPDVSKWTVPDWLDANSGILMGRHGTNLTLRNNYVQNTRFGINLCAPDSLCEGNVVTDFSGDGIRVTRDGLTVQYNTIKNVYCSGADGDKNHDDAIQCFLFNKGTGTVRNVTVRGNIIINREDDAQMFPASLQAIGFFDGPLIDFLVEKNVVLTSHWHGVSLYDAQNCRILDNVVHTRWMKAKPRPWVQLGQKQGLAKGNTVRGNFAHSFDFKADESVTAENNRRVTEKIFTLRLKELEAFINKKFGAHHPVSGYSRLGARKRR